MLMSRGSNCTACLVIPYIKRTFCLKYVIREIFVGYISNGCGPGSVVGIAAGYGLDGPGIEFPVGGEIFRTCPDRPWGPLSLLYNGYRLFLGGK